MNAEERQQIVDIAELIVHRYFDHYLTDVFPEQMDRLFKDHDADVGAHPAYFKVLAKTKRRVDRILWMVAGGSAVIGCLGGLAVSLGPKIFKVLFS